MRISSEDSEETEIVTKDEELIIYVGDETDGSRYVKVNDSNQVYTISEDSLADILDKTIADFYDLTVSYLTGKTIWKQWISRLRTDHMRFR